MDAGRPYLAPLAMATGLKRRLLLLLFVPLLLVVGVNTWFDLRSAENAALQQDRMLGALVPLLADSVIAGEASALRPPVVLMAPAVDDFLNARAPKSAYALLGNEGLVLVGSPWLSSLPPPTREPEFSSDEHDGTTYRIVSQRVHTAAGDLTVRLADGSDQRQQWLHSVWVKAILPNLLLVAIAGFAINWAVGHALQPLLALKEAVERRSPDDLSALDTHSTPDEVLPLVESLNRLFGMVNAQAENQRRFVADAAHQLRTPLAALQAQVEAWAQNLAVAPMDSAEAAIKIRADQIFQLRHAARRTSQLANQLLALSRVDARSRQSEPWQRVDLKHLCEVLMENYLDTAAARQIDLGLDAAPTHADGLEWLLRELLTNLLDNALKYTPAGGHVTLRCGVRAAPGRDATALPYVEVEDDGPGLDAVQRSRVLERFYRVPGTQGEGNGLGLAIADEIARVHHTTLELQSGAGGRGLSVSITLQS